MRLGRTLFSAAKLTSAALLLATTQSYASAQVSTPCPRFPVGSAITAPQDLFSRNGVLQVTFTYETATDQNGNTLYCFVNSDGAQSPTLHLHPGDRLLITLTNNVPVPAGSSATMPAMTISGAPSSTCGAMVMTASSVNIHYHGTNTAPTCHQDEVIHSMINSGETFEYDVQFPRDEPPGLYWYHPHIHGISEAAVQGGASGALIVEGIQNVNPMVAGLTQQVLIIRDNLVPGNPTPGGNIPSWDLSEIARNSVES
jgi:FtsP/CotA-like multicopper oxidase with cupredoxin domain